MTATTKTATTTPARNGRRKFDDQLRQFLADLARHDANIPTHTALDGPRKEWEQARDNIILPVLRTATEELLSSGRRGKVEVTADGGVKWHVTLYDSKSTRTYDLSYAVQDTVTQLVLSEGEAERVWPLSSVTASFLGDRVLGLLIQVAYSRSV